MLTATTAAPPAPAPPATAPAEPLSFDDRLALAVLAIDTRIDSTPLDLADIIRMPVDTEPEPCPYSTPIAATLHQARARLARGWCTGMQRDPGGAVCLVGAIRAVAPSRHAADDACVLLLEVIKRQFPGAQTVPSWNDAQTGPGQPTEFLRRAAILADNRGL